MAKKKKAAAGANRGFATTSMPSKPKPSANETKPAEKQVKKEPQPMTMLAPTINQPTPVPAPAEEQQQQEEEEDQATRLAKRFAFINKRKAESLLRELSRTDNTADNDEKLRPFALTANIEFDLFQILKSHQRHHDAISGPSSLQVKNSLEYDKAVGHLDVIYRTLVELGFKPEDVEEAFRATSLADIHELLDWLCVHVPYERMPIGFFDKYFTEEGMSIRAEWAEEGLEEGRPRHVEAFQEQQPLAELAKKEEEKNNTQEADEYKARILQAAQQYYDDDSETEEDVNEKYAQHKLALVQLEEQLPSGKKKKKNNSGSTSGVNVQEIQDKINTLRQTLRDLETDWMYDKSKSHELFVQLDREATEKAREARKKQHQDEPPQPQPQEHPLFPNEANNDEEEEADIFGFGGGGDDDDEIGLFGGMLDEPQQDETARTPTTATMAWEVVDVSKKGWIGQHPKDMLAEYCKKHDYVKQVYTKTELGTSRWRATVKLVPRQISLGNTLVETQDNLAAKSAQDAEQLVAMTALFQLDPSSSIYRIMSPPLKELWLQWVEKKNEEELKAQLEGSQQRMQLFVDIVDASLKNQESLDNSVPATPDAQTGIKPHDVPTDNKQNDTRISMFRRVQQAFEKRTKSADYRKMKEKRNELPMMAYRDEVLRLVRENQVVIVSGETGCGKSTQVPQFLAEDLLLAQRDYGSVICTQPRRISAMSIAKRVSQEMGDYPRSLGTKNGMVGYQIRLENKVAEENVLVFCTTGILLRRLESDRELRGITHVVVDEIHERTLDSDFLLIVLRQLCRRRPNLKVILMSATVEAHRFSNYFGGCPVIAVPGRTFPVQVKYLEDVIEATGYTLEEDSRYAIRRERVHKGQGSVQVSGGHGTTQKIRYDWFDDDDPYDPARVDSKLTVKESGGTQDDDEDTEELQQKYSEQTMKMVRRIDESKINYDLILDLLDYICIRAKETKDNSIPVTGAILVFLPGMPEIRRLYDMVASHKELGDTKKYILIALHSTLSSEHQERAFDIPPAGMRKIVLSTNIAETGVTISDVTVVIDTGMAKVVSYDQKRRITRLRQQFITKANARQRRGRAGRVQEGLCFHLFAEPRFAEMADYETPEILRLPLEELCLRIKVCELGSIKEFLGTALDAPSPDLIQDAIETLQEVQALSTDSLESLTSLGSHLANLPVDVHIGKMILFGAIFRCLDPVLTIAAALSFKSPFVRPFGKELEADMARAKFRYADSDFWTICNAYQSWRAQLQKLQTKPGWWRKIRSFCDMNFLSETNLEMIEDMKRQYLELLIDIGFVKTDDSNELKQQRYGRGMRWCPIPLEYNVHSGSVPVVNAAIMAGLYPKLAARKDGVFENAKYSGMLIHPSSMLHGRELSLMSDFLVFNTVVMSHDRIYLWEAAAIDPVAVMLLCSDMEIKHKQKVVVLDKWIKFQCYARSAALLKFLRSELNNWLTAKMKKPDLDLTHYSQEIMDVMIKTLESRVE